MALTSEVRLGSYELIAPLGTGATGEAYKAVDTRFNRTVVIKLFKSCEMDRIARQATVIAALDNPYICPIHDIGEDYLVMECVEGKPISGPLPQDESVRLANQIASALEAAHSKGIIHQGLKPANILVAKGSVKLLDFGHAKPLSSCLEDADPKLCGVAAYMSPEQVQQQPIDQRSDVFSFGAILFEMLTGQRAFAGDSTREVLDAIVGNDPPPPETTPELRRIAMRCLRKDPADRFQSMADVRMALGQIPIRKARQPSVAVLPFANLSSEKENEYFSDGLTEEVINQLAHIPGLRVTARTSAFAFRKRQEDIRKIATTLDVQAILEGSVRQSGNRIRVTAQLINAADGYHLWSQRYDKELPDVFAIEDDIAQAIAKALRLRLYGGSAIGIAAYQAYLKARFYAWKFTPEALGFSRECYEQAIALDPEFALAHSGLAEYHLARAVLGMVSADEAIPKVRVSARSALHIDPSLSEAHAVLGTVAGLYDEDWQEAERYFDLAMMREPVSSAVHVLYGYYYLLLRGRPEDAVLVLERGLRDDPLNGALHLALSVCLFKTGDRTEAFRRLEQAVELQYSVWAMALLAIDYDSRGMEAEALAWAERARSFADWNPMPLGLLAGLLVKSGEATRAKKVTEELRNGRIYGAPFGLAVFHLVAGDINEAADWLEKVLDEQYCLGGVIHLLNSPLGNKLASSSRWPALAEDWPLIEKMVHTQDETMTRGHA